MTDEEKKAIEILGEFKKNGFHLLNLKYESRVSTTKHIENSIEIILELIEKQQKEIEELKDKCKKKNKTIETMQFIKAIQKAQENTNLIIEEQCAVKNKYMLEVSNGEFVDANELYSIWKNSVSTDKIKAKIEEYEHKDFIKMQVVMKHDKEALKIVEVLQSLLEEKE